MCCVLVAACVKPVEDMDSEELYEHIAAKTKELKVCTALVLQLANISHTFD